MLIAFTVGNFLSFKERATFSMEAANITEFRDTNVFSDSGESLLKSAVIYGANASGKSNLFKAMNLMRTMVIGSSLQTRLDQEIPVQKFKLSTECESEPSFFEVVFLKEGVRYRYGFELDPKTVRSEWLFWGKGGDSKETVGFTREESVFNMKNFGEGLGLDQKTRANALLLSVAAQFNGEISTKVVNWFSAFSVVASVPGWVWDESLRGSTLTTANLKNEEYKKEILTFMRIADIDIHDLEVELMPDDFFPFPKSASENVKKWVRDAYLTRVFTRHQKYDSEKKAVSLERLQLESEESEGTKKLFAMAGPILDSLKKGTVLAVDELDARMHPLITRFLVSLFNHCANSRCAQLIFATHDTNLLIECPFRRDQIWFTEKDKYGASDIYSLVEFKEPESGKKVRKDASFGKDYILGKYGAIPFIGDLKALLSHEDAR
jgi:hypothetical protein